MSSARIDCLIAPRGAPLSKRCSHARRTAPPPGIMRCLAAPAHTHPWLRQPSVKPKKRPTRAPGPCLSPRKAGPRVSAQGAGPACADAALGSSASR